MKTSAALLLALVPGCASFGSFGSLGEVPIAPEAKLIQVGFTAPSPTCRNMGMVVGATSAGSTMMPTDEHVERALNDALNKAAALGSNYLQTQPPQLKSMNWGVVGATIMGVAWRCPPETPEAQAYAAGFAQLRAEKRQAEEQKRQQAAQAEEARRRAERTRAMAESARAAKAAGEADPSKPARSAAEIVASNADRAKQLEANAPQPPIKLDRVELDDVEVARDFPEGPCTPLGEEKLSAPDRSVVRAITQLRKNALGRRANLVVLDPVDGQAAVPVLLGRYYACPR